MKTGDDFMALGVLPDSDRAIRFTPSQDERTQQQLRLIIAMRDGGKCGLMRQAYKEVTHA